RDAAQVPATGHRLAALATFGIGGRERGLAPLLHERAVQAGGRVIHVHASATVSRVSPLVSSGTVPEETFTPCGWPGDCACRSFAFGRSACPAVALRLAPRLVCGTNAATTPPESVAAAPLAGTP